MSDLSQKYQISYAQNREDIILSGFFDINKKGFYVDIGAFHPEEDSVTKIFYDKGWQGINIEPNPRLYRLFEKSRKEDINLNIGISDKEGELLFREYPDAEGYLLFLPQCKKNTMPTYLAHQKLEDILTVKSP